MEDETMLGDTQLKDFFIAAMKKMNEESVDSLTVTMDLPGLVVDFEIKILSIKQG